MRVYHILPTMVYGDAVSNDTRAINTLLVQRLGLHCRIYAQNIAPGLADTLVWPLGALPETMPDDLLIYHLSTGGALNEQLAHMAGHKLIIYHNITPPEFFEPYDKNAAALTREGYAQAAMLAAHAEYCIADSAYNASELRRLGYTCPIDVVPILIPFEDYKRAPDPKVIEKYQDGRTNILFVGRIAPNKRQEDVIRAFDCYRRTYDKTARLFLVGSFGPEDRYYHDLRHYVRALGAKNVIFPGHISFAEILGYYAAGSAFLCMSDHEGFCVPLVEAMCFGVPVAAKNTTAVGDTLGGGGLLLPDADPMTAAAALRRLLTDDALKSQILAGQQQRLADFAYEKVAGQFLASFDKFLAAARQKEQAGLV